ncbi:MAG: S49 family peptidase [Pontibacterium sp.]
MSENHWNQSSKQSDTENDNNQDNNNQDSQAAENPASEALGKVKKNNDGKEWRLLERLVDGLYVEQRRARRWGVLFKSLTFLYLFALLGFAFLGDSFSSAEAEPEAHVAVINIEGPIAASEEASADNIIWALRNAFKATESKAVIMRINSPGGSPVQSGYIYDEVKRLRALNPEKKIYAVITDIGASGAYYIAASADEIYGDKASLVGSIGVVASGFGFVDLMSKLGVERRLYTAGDHKAFLDPFSPKDDKEAGLWQQVLDTTHRQFIGEVKKGRGERLKDDPRLFSGLVWTGEQAVELGLMDGLGSSSAVARDIIGVEALVDYTTQPKVWQQVLDRLSVTFAKTMSAELGLSAGAMPLR